MIGRRARVLAGSERGAAAVEFALIAPLLIILVFGIISYGYMLSFRQGMSQGASEGARAGAVWAAAYQTTQDAARIAAATTQINNALTSYGVSCSSGAVCAVTIGACGTAKCVTVKVSYPYAAEPLTPSFPLVPLPDTLTYTATARVS